MGELKVSTSKKAKIMGDYYKAVKATNKKNTSPVNKWYEWEEAKRVMRLALEQLEQELREKAGG